jgi:hypothetical protein
MSCEPGMVDALCGISATFPDVSIQGKKVTLARGLIAKYL